MVGADREEPSRSLRRDSPRGTSGAAQSKPELLGVLVPRSISGLEADPKPPAAQASIRAASFTSSPSAVASMRPLVIRRPTTKRLAVEPEAEGHLLPVEAVGMLSDPCGHLAQPPRRLDG